MVSALHPWFQWNNSQILTLSFKCIKKENKTTSQTCTFCTCWSLERFPRLNHTSWIGLIGNQVVIQPQPGMQSKIYSKRSNPSSGTLMRATCSRIDQLWISTSLVNIFETLPITSWIVSGVKSANFGARFKLMVLELLSRYSFMVITWIHFTFLGMKSLASSIRLQNCLEVFSLLKTFIDYCSRMIITPRRIQHLPYELMIQSSNLLLPLSSPLFHLSSLVVFLWFFS